MPTLVEVQVVVGEHKVLEELVAKGRVVGELAHCVCTLQLFPMSSEMVKCWWMELS